MRHLIASVLAVFSATAAAQVVSTNAPLTLTRIMANPDWIAVTPKKPYWGIADKTVYYWERPHGAPVAALHAVDLATGKAHRVPNVDITNTGSAQSDYDKTLTREVYVAHGDVFVRDLASGAVRQLTRGMGKASDPQFMTGGNSVSFRLGRDYYVADLVTGLLTRAANIKTANAPGESTGPYHYYSAEQVRLFHALAKDRRDAKAEREHGQALASVDASRGPEPFYLGTEVSVVEKSLSPDGEWMLVVTEPAEYPKGPKGGMPNYVTMNGRIQLVPVRRRVGWNDPAPQSLLLLDLIHHKSYPLNLHMLPGIGNDPLARLRKQAVAWDVKHGVSRKRAKASVKAPKVRPLQVWGIAWSDDGRRLALELRSIDNKDRWIATVDFKHDMKLVTRDRLTDPAWINWDYNDFGWLPDNDTLWYLSEASGYSQFYTEDVTRGHTRQWTHGRYEVSDPVIGRKGRYVYYRANVEAPGIYSVYRLDLKKGTSVQLTHLGGVNGTQPSMETDTRMRLSPNGSELLFYHSGMLAPPELYVISTGRGGSAERLTHTVKPLFAHYDWIVPRIVRIPSSHFRGSIYARLYLPHNYNLHRSYAGAVFIHGAGYLQDAHQGWSFYFHEMMFNNFLAQHGYVVIDMDYRGSKGYGRAWRTAIYQHMGHPEVQDITDGVHWIEKRYHVDPARLGVYGGSYGGFMTYMMMFRRPDLFQAGAALRPVADWANYNDLYTSDILNRPQIDPQAYEISSAIHFAQNLKHELLIAQGVEDNNVFFQDTVHMVQKLIELKNPHFETAFYPLEHHGFEAPTSWLDEYRRVWRLFCHYVSPRRDCHTDR